MTLEERAKEFVSKIASGTSQEMDYYANILVEFANETTKELQEDLKHKKIAIQNRKARIKDLEKENAELKEHIKADCIDCADYIKNQKLEKENAELKEKLRIATEYPEWSKTVKLAEKDCIKRLAEAREIIKGLLSCARNYPEGNLEKMQRAEQFLNNEVKK